MYANVHRACTLTNIRKRASCRYPDGPIVCVQLGDDSDVPILKNNYYKLMHDEFRRLGVTTLINTLINPGASGWWGHWSQADLVRTTGTFAALEFSSRDAMNNSTLASHAAFTRQQVSRTWRRGQQQHACTLTMCLQLQYLTQKQLARLN